MKERMKSLAEFLEELGQESIEDSKSAYDGHSKGLLVGRGDAYVLCAQWIREELEKGN